MCISRLFDEQIKEAFIFLNNRSLIFLDRNEMTILIKNSQINRVVEIHNHIFFTY